MDIIAYTVKQGLAHPLQVRIYVIVLVILSLTYQLQLFPVIVALETSPIPSLSGRAVALHTLLHSKHTSLLNSRFVISARASFDYQKVIEKVPKGYRMQPAPTAVMQQWYSLVREKRTQRQDFLKALVKVFDVEMTATSQVSYSRPQPRT